jgi:predicted MFS family arabinose efflux permease
VLLEVARGLVRSDDVGMSGRWTPAERIEQRDGEIHPLGSVLVADARVDLHPAQPPTRHLGQLSQRVGLGNEQRERLEADEPTGQLGWEGSAQRFRPAEGGVDAPGEHLRKRGAHAAAVAHRELELGRGRPRGVDDACGDRPLADDVHEERTGCAPQLLERSVVGREQGSSVHEQALTSGGEGHSTRAPDEQRGADLILQPTDVSAQRLLRHIEPVRRAGEVQLLGDGDERAEQSEVELFHAFPMLVGPQLVLDTDWPPTDRCRMTSRWRIPPPLALLVLANAVSLSGNVITTVAIPWLVLTTTGSAALAGVAIFAGAAAAAAGGLGAGRIVDAIGPVRTSAVADLLSGLAVAPLPILLAVDALEIWHVVLLVVGGTLADSAGSAARQSLVPATADAAGYPRERANGLFTSAEHVGYLLGAPIAGLLIAAVGVGGALWVTVASFAIAALVIAGLVRVPAPRSPVEAPERTGLREAIGFIWSDPALRALVVIPTMATLLVGPLVPLVLPVLAREAFADPVVLGVMVASYGAGGLLGATGFGMVGVRIRRRRLFIGVFVIWPATYAAIALVPILPVALAMLLLLGAAAGTLVPLMATIRQERSPARLLPRVVGLSTASIPVAGPIGVLVTGVVIDGLGLHQAMLLMTAGAALIGAAVITSRDTHSFDPYTASPQSGGVSAVAVGAGA